MPAPIAPPAPLNGRAARDSFSLTPAPRIVDEGDPGEHLLRRSGHRPSGVTRFIRETFTRTGVRVVVFLEGGNDIDGRGGPARPAAMIDFDAALRDPRHPVRMRKAYAG